MRRCYPVTVVTAPQTLLLIETGVMHDGEPIFALAEPHGGPPEPQRLPAPNRCVRRKLALTRKHVRARERIE